MLTVLNVAYPFAPVGPDAVGGAEQVLTQLDAALVRAGHRSIVIACEGSRTAGALIPTRAAPAPYTDAVCSEIRAEHRRRVASAVRQHRPDLVHLHGIDCVDYLPPERVATLVTLHLPPTWYDARLFSSRRPNTWLHAVSYTQHRACPPLRNLLPPIPNGVDLDVFRPRAKRNFALTLGRICPEKNFHVALSAGRRANMPVLLAGQVYPYQAHEGYFRELIVRNLDQRRRFIGPIGLTRKRRLLSAARCLLAPSLAPETSSLVAMEALASGTPVIAFPSGALAEIVEHGRTGFLVRSEGEMVDAIREVHRIDPADCRAAAACRFPLNQTTHRYLEVYDQLATARLPAA